MREEKKQMKIIFVEFIVPLFLEFNHKKTDNFRFPVKCHKCVRNICKKALFFIISMRFITNRISKTFSFPHKIEYHIRHFPSFIRPFVLTFSLSFSHKLKHNHTYSLSIKQSNKHTTT